MVIIMLWLMSEWVLVARGLQLAGAAVLAGADGAAELAALEAGGGVGDSAVATAVYDCHYRPYTQRQARIRSHDFPQNLNCSSYLITQMHLFLGCEEAWPLG